MSDLAGDGWRILVGDVRDRLAELEADSVDCVVTSPPYYGLRDYGTGEWTGGDDGCDHVGTVKHTAPAGTAKQASNAGSVGVTSGPCRCGAVRVDSQIGLEPTPAAFVDELVSVFRDVRRVLAPHGVAWLNLGDTYGAQGLAGVPWRVALALQADGWYLRRDVIWDKPNPMPESVRSRPSTAHEYLFMLTKSRRYYYDRAAVLEPVAASTVRRLELATANGAVKVDASRGDAAADMAKPSTSADGRNLRSVWRIPTESLHYAHFATFPRELARRCILLGSPREVCASCGRPRERLTSTTPTTPTSDGSRYSAGAGRDDGGRAGLIGGELVTLGWSECGCAYGLEPDALELIATPTGDGDGIEDPSVRVGRAGYARPRAALSGVRPITRHEQRAYAAQLREHADRDALELEAGGATTFAHYVRTDRAGARAVPPELLERWLDAGVLERVELPSEARPNAYRAGVVLDPFIGSGTTGIVARLHGREAVGVELNPANAQLAADRVEHYWRKDARPLELDAAQLSLVDEALT